MDAGNGSLTLAIGVRVRQERQSRRWTQDQLATAAGISRRMLANVEQGVVNASIGTLLSLSNALGVGLPHLVKPPAADPTRLVRHGEGAALWVGDAGGRGVLVAGTEPPHVVELWDWTLMPGERHDSAAHVEGTRELLQVSNGHLVIEAAGTSFALDTGDALTFPGDAPHAYLNTTDQPARFTLSVFEPGVGTTHRTGTTHD